MIEPVAPRLLVLRLMIEPMLQMMGF